MHKPPQLWCLPGSAAEDEQRAILDLVERVLKVEKRLRWHADCWPCEPLPQVRPPSVLWRLRGHACTLAAPDRALP